MDRIKGGVRKTIEKDRKHGGWGEGKGQRKRWGRREQLERRGCTGVEVMGVGIDKEK